MPMISPKHDGINFLKSKKSLSIEQIQDDMNNQRDPRPEMEVEYVPPQNPIEKKLAEIWAELLHIEKVGANDDFFQLGGHSLLAIEIIARVNQEFLLDIETPTFFNSESNKLAKFAQIIEANLLEKANKGELEFALREVSQLTHEEVQSLLKEMER